MQAELDEATEKVHEEWRQKRRSEFASLGVSEEVPQWKRIEPHEYGSNGIFFASVDHANGERRGPVSL